MTQRLASLREHAARLATASLAIVCGAGGMRGAFVHGALLTLEDAGVRADVYAGVSSSAVLAAQAAIGRVQRLGEDHWDVGRRTLEAGGGMSTVVDRNIEFTSPLVQEWLFERGAPRLLIPACHVRFADAARSSQGEAAVPLGRELLLQVGRGDRSWVDANLELHVFDTQSRDANRCIRGDNLADILFATTRMPHAGQRPAAVDGRPYVDGVFLCLNPILEAAALGTKTIVAVAPEPGPLHRDLFRDRAIPESLDGCQLHVIRPAMELSELGVDVTRGTAEGLVAALRHGEAQATAFLQSLEPVIYERRPRTPE